MALSTKSATVIVGIAILVVIWIYVGQDPGRLIEYIRENLKTTILTVQVIAAFLLAATKHYVAGAILLLMSMATLYGVLF